MIVIAGPCVIEDRDFTIELAKTLGAKLNRSDIDFYFKASYDKANRSSIESFRGPGLKGGLKILEQAKKVSGAKVLTDFHNPGDAFAVAEVVDCLQVPAFLCRQTDIIVEGTRAALEFGKRLNVKKGQFLAPWDAKNIVQKVQQTIGSPSKLAQLLSITERGTSFGYNQLMVDMSAFQTVRQLGIPVIYDATHSVQSPGSANGGTVTGGKRENIEVLARAAFAAGADGVFLECHPNPSASKSDAANAFYLEFVDQFIDQLLSIRKLVEKMPFLCPESRALHSSP